MFFRVHITHMISRLRSILDYLRVYGTSSRYFADKFYTSIGDVLVAVNPFKETNAFTLEVISTASIGGPCIVCATCLAGIPLGSQSMLFTELQWLAETQFLC